MYCLFVSLGQQWVNSRYKLETSPSEIIDTKINSLKKMELDVSINPNPPIIGENTLRVEIKNPKTKAKVNNIHVVGEAFYGSKRNHSIAFKLPFTKEGDYEDTIPLEKAGSWRLILKIKLPDDELILRNFYCTVKNS